MIVDLTQRQIAGGWAKYLPAISGFYTTHLGKDLSDPKFITENRLPDTFEHGIQGLNFLKSPEETYYSYQYGLYSAGHAERRLDKCDSREPMIHNRDRSKTTLIGDSGGFQVATGVIKMDWASVKTGAGDKLREEILRYLEHTSDWSMTLDVPAFAALPPLNEKTGLTRFEDCLDVSLHNLDYFIKHRVPGATKFLSVLSGSSDENSKQWYEAVKKYSIPTEVENMGYTRDRTLEGWAFAGINMKRMESVLNRILDLKDDNLLADKNWIHFLGIGRLDWACYLTSIERNLKKHYNPNINISFDAASPFVAAGGYALSYNYNKFNPDQLTYAMSKGIDDKSLKGSKMGLPFQSPINDRLTVGDLCVMGPTDLNKQGKIGNTSWDTTTYALVMAHNVYNHIQAVQEINRLSDIEYATSKNVNYLDWWTSGRSKKIKAFNLSKFVPNNILFFNDFVTKLLDPKNTDARKMLLEAKDFLSAISFDNKVGSTTMGDTDMWGTDVSNTSKEEPTVEEMASMYDMENPEIDI